MTHASLRPSRVALARSLATLTTLAALSACAPAANSTPDASVDSATAAPDATSEPDASADSATSVADVTSSADATSADSASGPTCEAHAVSCADESAMRLRYLTVQNPSEITNEPLGAGEFRSVIDARAGGASATQSYVYARFTATGLSKVALTDEDALRSTEWDIALRRFVLRLNSGVSGPSCVRGARLSATDWASVTRIEDPSALREESYFDGACQFVDDGSGINGPATVLAPYWRYAGCLQMTNAIFVAQLRDGRAVKLTVESYYDPEKQAECDATGMVSTPNNAAVFRLRWSLLP